MGWTRRGRRATERGDKAEEGFWHDWLEERAGGERMEEFFRALFLLVPPPAIAAGAPPDLPHPRVPPARGLTSMVPTSNRVDSPLRAMDLPTQPRNCLPGDPPLASVSFPHQPPAPRGRASTRFRAQHRAGSQ